jgi:serine/threonine-protein kinase
MRSEALLREHAGALPASHPARSGHFAYLKGDGALTLVTDPPGAEVLLHRYTLQSRRLVPVFERSLVVTPLRDVSLPRGSYLCVLRHPDRAEVRYPVHIERQAHWDGVPPEGGDPHPVWLPPVDALDDGDCYVPAGWFVAGGDPGAPNALPRRRLWCDGVVFRRFPVTNAEYIAFLDDLVARGREDEALRYVPREHASRASEQGAMIYGYTGGRFGLVADKDGDVWHRDWPVCMVDCQGAHAYAVWCAQRTGRPWRLPDALAWEKAARGVDGRFYPWGDGFDPSWACMKGSHQGRGLPSVVESYPVDTSPYGVRGMAGNMMDWCADVYRSEGLPTDGQRVLPAEDHSGAASQVGRGGSWGSTASFLRTSFHFMVSPSFRSLFQGFRLSRAAP